MYQCVIKKQDLMQGQTFPFSSATAVCNHSTAFSVHPRPLKVYIFKSVELIQVHEPQTLCFTGQNVARTWHNVIASLLRSLSQFLENAQLLPVPGYPSFLRFMNLVYLWTTT